MSPARAPRGRPLDERLLLVDTCSPGRPASGAHADARMRDLPSCLRRGDLLVVNDAATLPASLRGETEDGASLEARLVRRESDGTWQALLFGTGDWRTPTEHRPAPPAVEPGTHLDLGELRATVASLDGSPRMVHLVFDREGAQLWSALYRAGRPIQYSHTERAFDLWDVQTAYASRPWAAEMPSAGRPLTWELLLGLRRRGVTVVSVTTAVGITSTGEAHLDARLPGAERYEIPAHAADAIAAARAGGGRVVATGTSVVRALEASAAANGGHVTAGAGDATLVLGPGTPLRAVDGLLTGMHERASSHFALLAAFCPPAVLDAAYDHAETAGYLVHEFGDSSLFLPGLDLPPGEGPLSASGAG